MGNIQHFLFRHLESSPNGESKLSRVNRLLILFIVFSSTVAILETEITIRSQFPSFFKNIEILVVTIFTAEYVLRFIAVGYDRNYQGIKGRVKYIFSFWSIIDLMAILPFFLTGLTDNTFFLRLIRILRILRLAKLGRYSTALQAIVSATARKKHELIMSAVVAFSVMLTSSTLLYVLEGSIQPDAFGSIIRSVWWSIATLTTVGYGDVTPITAAGRFFAGITAIAGIGLIAMPTGILASAFSEALRDERQNQKPAR